VRRCTDNAVVGGAVPPRRIVMSCGFIGKAYIHLECKEI
jgi:hypothetical protein